MKTPKVKGHSLKLERHERYGNHRLAADYTAVCECGFRVAVWADRLSAIRMRHHDHLRTIAANQETTMTTNYADLSRVQSEETRKMPMSQFFVIRSHCGLELWMFSPKGNRQFVRFID